MELQARTPRHEAKEHAWHLVYGDVQFDDDAMVLARRAVAPTHAAALARARALLCLTESLRV